MEKITSNICKTSNIGVNDNLFGGVMLSWIDEAGAILASKLCGTTKMVTVRMNSVEFKKPVKVGTHIYFAGAPIRIGQTSITLTIIALDGHDQSVLCDTEIVFVKIDEEGKATSIDIENRTKIKGIIEDKDNTSLNIF